MNELNASTFKEWFANHYELDEIKDIYAHGCVSGCAHGLIYYSETNAIYDNFGDEIHEIVNDFFLDCGSELPASITDNLGSLAAFKNAMVWCCAEILAGDTVNMLELA